MWYSGVACMIVMIIGIIVSLITNSRKNDNEIQPVDPDLLASGVETLFCCWPRKMRQWIAVNNVFASSAKLRSDYHSQQTADVEMVQMQQNANKNETN
jgi:hypothetical protein